MIISTQKDSNSMAACTGRLMLSIVYYMVMGALGRHQFAHIPDSRITRLQFGIFMALTSIPISMNCNLSPAEAIVNSFSTVILFAFLSSISPPFGWIKFTALATSISGINLLLMPAWMASLLMDSNALVAGTALVATILILTSIKINDHIFKNLPNEMRINGYQPST